MNTQRDINRQEGKGWHVPPTGSNSLRGSPETEAWHEGHIRSHRRLLILALIIVGFQALNLLVITYGLVSR